MDYKTTKTIAKTKQCGNWQLVKQQGSGIRRKKGHGSIAAATAVRVKEIRTQIVKK